MKQFFGSTVSGVVVMLFLTSVLTAFNVQTVEASSHTIYIRADGSIDPPTAFISSLDNVTYIFTSNINDEIVVERDNIVVDGAGYTLQGNGIGKGLYLLGRSNVTIKNTEIKSFQFGILLELSSNNTISGNNITNNHSGIWLGSSSNNTVSGNDITENHLDGIYLSWSSNNTLRNNDASKNECNFGVFASLISDYIQDIDDSNTVDGKPVYYWVNRRDMAVPLDAGYVALINCTRMTVKNLNLTHNWQGVLLAFTTNSTITKNNIIYNGRGILLSDSSNNKIYHNDFIYNAHQTSVTAGYTNIWDDGYPSGGNYWSDHVCTGNPSDGSQPYVIDANNTDHYPFQHPVGWPPTIVVLSPQNTTYATSSVPLTFTISESASWMGYSLDGQLNVTVTENTILSGLSDGPHSLIVYANDTAGNMGSSDIVYFTIDTIPPIAEAGMDQTVSEATRVTLDGSNSTDNIEITSYTWTFMDVTTQTLSGATVTYRFTTLGVHTITLNVTDAAGNWDTDTVIITVLLDTDRDGTPDVTDTDDDGDGMPDTWETENGLDTLDAADAFVDRDGDGLNNLREYQGGTNPNSYFSPFPLWIAGVAVAAVVGVAIAVYFVKVRKPKTSIDDLPKV